MLRNGLHSVVRAPTPDRHAYALVSDWVLFGVWYDKTQFQKSAAFCKSSGSQQSQTRRQKLECPRMTLTRKRINATADQAIKVPCKAIDCEFV